MIERTFFDEELKNEVYELREDIKPFKGVKLKKSDLIKLQDILSVDRQEFLRDKLLAETAFASTALESFTNDYVKHHFFLDKHESPLLENTLSYKLLLEGRCGSCNHISVQESQPHKVITDHQLMPYLTRKQNYVKDDKGWELPDSVAIGLTGIYPICETPDCFLEGKLTELVTSRNRIILDHNNLYNIVFYSQREKSDGSGRDKFIDLILGIRDNFFDRLAARFVVERPEDVYNIVEKLKKRRPKKISYKPNGIMPEKYSDFAEAQKEHEIPVIFEEEREYRKKQDYYAVHMAVPWSWTDIEVQIKTHTWHHIAEHTVDLEHKRRLERKELVRQEEWGALGFKLREYLTPVFAKYDFVNYLQ